LKNPLDSFSEENHLSLFITGRTDTENWNSDNKKIDIFILKGILSSLLKRIGIPEGRMDTVLAQNSFFTEGMSLVAGDKKILDFGTVSQQILRKFDIRQDVFFAEINWNRLLAMVAPGDKAFSDLPKYPEVRRDLALELNEKISFAEIEKIAMLTERKLIKKTGLFDVYQGDKIESGKKSYAVYFILQDEMKTLTDSEIDKVMAKLIKAFTEKLDARIR
jgi:phenylalanyl-tRNA synthetase beta chain